MKDKNTEIEKKDSRLKVWFKKLGVAGFLFFFVKGLVWIAIFAFGVEGCNQLF